MGKRVGREGPIHRAIVAYLRAVMPKAIIHHSANESHLSGRGAMLATVRKKADGMLPGFPDILVLPYATVGPMLFEVKAEGGKVTETQKAVHDLLAELGYRVAVVRSVDDARETLREWSIPTNQIELWGQNQ